MKKYCLLILLFSASLSYGQSWDWGSGGITKTINDLGEGYGVASDTSHNVYLSGYFRDTMRFGTYTFTANQYNGNAYLVKYDSNGNLLWAAAAKAKGNIATSNAWSVASDAWGNAYITGYYRDTVTFGNDTLIDLNYNIFLAKYNKNGSIAWVKHPLGNGSGSGLSVSVNNYKDEYITGYFGGTLIFGLDTLNSVGGSIFIVKYDSSGNVLWAKQGIIPSAKSFADGFSVTSNNINDIYVTGVFQDTLIFGATKLISLNYDVFIVKYDSNGNLLWAKQCDLNNTNSSTWGYSITTDVNDAAYLTGWFIDSVSFGGHLVSSIKNRDFFIAKYDANGNAIWAKAPVVLDTNSWQGYTLSMDKLNDLYFSGGVSGGYSDQGIVYGTDTFKINGASDPAVILKLDTAGNLLCGSIERSGGDDQNGIVSDPTGRFIYWGGDLMYGSTYIFGNDTLSGKSEFPFVARWRSLDLKITIASFTNSIGCTPTGTATANAATGGTAPYTYHWAPSGGSNLTASGLSAGIYTITVTDSNNHTATVSVTITQPNILNVSANVTANVSCNEDSNGNASSTVSGGTTPYTYLWSNSQTSTSISSLSAGTYTLTVQDNNGCTATASVIITQPNILSISANTTTNVSCNGGSNGSVSSTVNGGTSPFTYSWSGGGGTNSTATGLSAGTYSITVQDSCGGSVTASVTVTQPATALNVLANTTANETCNGGSNGQASGLISGGTTPYTYLWSGGGTNSNVSGLSAGTYTLTVTDNNGCTGTATAIITQPSALAVVGHTLPTSILSCTGAAWVNVSGGVSPYTYSWAEGQTTDSVFNQCHGSYCCKVIDANGCVDSACVTINISTGVDNISSNSGQITIYPNPNNGIFMLYCHTELVSASQTITIYNVLGEQVYNATLNQVQGDNNINISNQPNGIYLIRVITNDGNLVGQSKVVKE